MNRLVTTTAFALILFQPLTYFARPESFPPIRWAQLGFLVAAVGWLTLVARLAWSKRDERGSKSPVAILVLAVICRLLVLGAEPSDDVYRYLWEGRVSAAGHSPYVVAPADERLTPLRDQYWPKINHPEHRAIYPPLAQTIFVAVAAIHPHPIAFKIAFLGAELFAIVLLMRWARRRTGDARRVLIYALCPLALTAVAIEAHLDALVVLGIAIMLDRLDRPDERSLRWQDALLGCLGFGLAVGTKWTPLVLGPWVLVQLLRGRRWTIRDMSVVTGALAAAGAVICAPAIFYLEGGPSAIFDPLRNFATAFHVLDILPQALASFLQPNQVQVVSALLLSAVALSLARARGDAAVLWTFGTLLLLSPTLHPWYLTWILPALVVRRSLPWVLLTVSIVFAYEGNHLLQQTGAWSMPAWVGWWVFTPFFAAMLSSTLWQSARRIKESRQSPNPPAGDRRPST